MSWKQLWARKSLDRIIAEADSEDRLHRVLGPVALTSLGIGAIIGAGIFAITGRVAAEDAGPSIMVSFIVAGVACGFAAFCYSEFAAMAPVAGSAYTYTYATLGELWAWIIGWDLVLEYAMSGAVVAAHWANYLDEFLFSVFGWNIPRQLLDTPFNIVVLENGVEAQGWCNLPAMFITLLVTAVLVLGIRESATTNTIMVIVKLAVVLFVIIAGWKYVAADNWTKVSVDERRYTDVIDFLDRHPELDELVPHDERHELEDGTALWKRVPQVAEHLTAEDLRVLKELPSEAHKWGLLGVLGFKQMLVPLDNRLRSSFFPYGLSGLMVGAAIVFFSYIGFDSISTHSEEARNPQRDVPIGILASLVLCTVLYMAVAAIITGMEPYPRIDTKAAVAAAFSKRDIHFAAGLISTGALAGMTSVLLVTYLSQARIFLAMARDGLLPPSIFAAIHPRFRTPHRSTILTGVVMSLVAGFTPIRKLEEMVSIGTLMAFVLVCASVLILRRIRPDARRPFRCPMVYVVAPCGIIVNLALMLFLPVDTWARLVVWLTVGLAIYFAFGMGNSTLGREATAGPSGQSK